MSKIYPQDKSNNQKFEYEKIYDSTTNYTVWIHFSHGKEEREANILIGRLLADWGETVLLLPTSSERDAKNPDAEINGEIWEFKTNSAGTKNSIENGIKRGSKQADNVLLHLTGYISLADLEHAIYDRVRQCPALQKLRIIYETQLYEFTRATIINQSFRGAIKKEKGA